MSMSTRILVIEDNAANLELARYLLEAGGYTVLTAEDGEEGLRSARRDRPDLVVSDLQMPVMDGYEFLAHFRADEELRSIPVIAVTAFSMPGDATKVMQAGFDGYLSKPIVPETFIEQVAAYLPPSLRTAPR
jgi:two-component system, cell cycle response regulator DivK